MHGYAICHFGEHTVDSVFSSCRAYVQFSRCLHRRCSQKKAVLNFESGFEHQFRSHTMPQFPGDGAFLAEARQAAAHLRRHLETHGVLWKMDAEDIEEGRRSSKKGITDYLFAQHTLLEPLCLIWPSSDVKNGGEYGGRQARSAAEKRNKRNKSSPRRYGCTLKRDRRIRSGFLACSALSALLAINSKLSFGGTSIQRNKSNGTRNSEVV